MIKFKNLEKACKALDFEIENYGEFKSVVDKGYARLRFMNFSPDTPWAISFTDFFNVLECSEKSLLIKAITRDYEEFLNGDD